MRRVPIVPALAVVGLSLAACGSTAPGTVGPSTNAIAVSSSSGACTLSATSAPAGPTSFRVTNVADDATEFYVLAARGERIVGRVENIGPAITRELTLVLKAGTYTVACRPGLSGDGIRSELTVTGATTAATGDVAALAKAATAYTSWVAVQAAQLLSGTTAFVEAVKDGDIAAAKALYAPTRAHWERIEPVASSFRDLDQRLDPRENDVEDGGSWTGWHRVEKALWVEGSVAGLAPVADQLLTDTQDLVTRIATVALTADEVTSGARELIEEVSTGKVTGEEERYSHTDLWDFQANVDGARKAYDVVGDLVFTRDPELAKEIELSFVDLQKALDVHRRGDGFVLYTELTDAQVRGLAAKVEALSEPLARLTATVVS